MARWSRGSIKIGHTWKGGASRMGASVWLTEVCDLAPFRAVKSVLEARLKPSGWRDDDFNRTGVLAVCTQ